MISLEVFVLGVYRTVFQETRSQFGNALYDKSQKNVDHVYQAKKISQTPAQVSQPSQQNHLYAPLRQLGLDVQEQDGELVVTGQTYGKQQTIEGLGFRWNADRKTWHKQIRQAA